MKKSTALLFTALALGLGWAIRGHFGHEYGAAWAGVMAGLAVLLAVKRDDWSARLPVLGTLAGIGWGVGGMMSYGIIVGYGRGIDFGNVYYGLTMLGVVGGLYGFIGGGFFGLGLETTKDHKPDWARLLTEMIAGGLIAWYVIVAQFEWKMTPPRSELWAACFGASIALAWFLYRSDFKRALRVAGYAALGAGFGFGFGNFLQTMGAISGMSFNWWNVMEFTLGFCGGLGMSYAVLTRDWPKSVEPSKAANRAGIIFLLLGLPLINLILAMDAGHFIRAAESLSIVDSAAFARTQIGWAYVIWLVLGALGILLHAKWSCTEPKKLPAYTSATFFLITLYYMLFSLIQKHVLVKGASFQLEQVLYWVVLFVLAALWFFSRKSDALPFVLSQKENWPRWLLLIGTALLVLALCAFISISSHGGIGGYHERF